MLAYSTLMSSSSDGLTDYAMRILQRLVVEYPVDRLYAAVNSSSQKDKLVRGVLWEDCVKNICMVPGKVANAFAARGTGDVPPVLENGMYFNNLSIRCEVLISSLSPSLSSDSTSTLFVHFIILFAFLRCITQMHSHIFLVNS